MPGRLFTISAAVCLAIIFAIAGYSFSTAGRRYRVVYSCNQSGVLVGQSEFLPYHDNRVLASIPINLFSVPFAILPLAWAVVVCRRERRRKRLAAGLCAGCGYDLRASPSRCPECGTVPKSLIGL